MMDETLERFAGLRVAVTGVSGTVGEEILRQLAQSDPAMIIGLDHNESGLFYTAQDYSDHAEVRLRLADVRDADAIRSELSGVDVVIHAAALKHVPLCEQSPLEAIQTNIQGTQNVLDAAIACGVERVLFTSSDKAVNPTSVMGTSKLMAERLVTAIGTHDDTDVVAISTRFGNVLGSRGSMLPIFDRQIRQGGPVTITHPDMTRFIMTLEQAVHLVLESVFTGESGQVLITKMPVAAIPDIAQVMIDELAPAYGHSPAAIEIKVTGPRPGEKLYEELVSEEEARRCTDSGDFIVVSPALESRSLVADIPPYNSMYAPALSRDELRDYLSVGGLLKPRGIS